MSMHEDLPPLQTRPAVGIGPDMAAPRDWIETWSAAEVAEIEAAAGALLESGADIAALRDHTLLHDFAEPERCRLLLRLWLAQSDARPLPQVFAQRYGSVVPGTRGGVAPRNGRLVVPWSA
jgi:hypothetical protein